MSAAVSLPPDELEDAPDPSAEATSAVALGIWISATRCFLTYVVAPAAGAFGVFIGPLGMVLQVLGAVTSTYGAITLWRLGHRARYAYALVAAAVTAASVAMFADIVMGAIR